MKTYAKILSIACLLVFCYCSSNDEEDLTPGLENGDNGNEENSGDRCEDNEATLSGNVLAIINNNCAVSGCHVSGGQFPNFTVRANIIQNASQIRSQVESGNMPAAGSGRTLTTQQKDDIFCWVENGAKDN